MATSRGVVVGLLPGSTCLKAGGNRTSRLIGHFSLFVIIHLLVNAPLVLAEGEIRCYCNEARCVRTGYMCKSALGRCYSQLTYDTENVKSVHGCVESLDTPDKATCGKQGDIVKTKSGGNEWPVLICCQEDMCNYIDSLDINIQVSGSSKSNGSTLKAGGRVTGSENSVEHRYTDEAYHDRELWFKAAVIAVPIAGGFILVLLVLLAVRMLRNDSRRHRQLLQMRHHRGLAKAQLYVADHFCDKNDHHLCFNSLEKNSQPHVAPPMFKDQAHLPPSVYKDVNLKMDLEGSGYERLKPCSHGNVGVRSNSIVSHSNKTASPSNQAGSHDNNIVTNKSSSTVQSTVSDINTKAGITLHTSATQTPPLNAEEMANTHNQPCDSVIVWADAPKHKQFKNVGEVV